MVHTNTNVITVAQLYDIDTVEIIMEAHQTRALDVPRVSCLVGNRSARQRLVVVVAATLWLVAYFLRTFHLSHFLLFVADTGGKAKHRDVRTQVKRKHDAQKSGRELKTAEAIVRRNASFEILGHRLHGPEQPRVRDELRGQGSHLAACPTSRQAEHSFRQAQLLSIVAVTAPFTPTKSFGILNANRRARANVAFEAMRGCAVESENHVVKVNH